MARSWLLVFAVACGGKSQEDTSTFVPPPTSGTEDTATDTGGGEAPKVVMEFSPGGWFGYDAATGTVVPVLDGGDEVPSVFYLEFRSTDYSGSCTDDTCCYVYVYTDGYAGESFATDDGYVFGFHVPQGAATGYTTCLDNGFDPADPAWGGLDPFDAWSGADHGFAIALGGLPSATVTDWTGNYDPYNLVIGGEFLSTDLGSEDSIYFESWSVDGSMEIQDTQVDRDAIVDGYGGLVTGYYQYDVMVHFDAVP